MSTFSVTFQVGDLESSRWETVEAVVDTGATFTGVPQDVLERLGIQPTRQVQSRIVDGRLITRMLGAARIRLEGMEDITPVVFREPGEPALLGAITLEQFLLGVDPVQQKLTHVAALEFAHSTTRSRLVGASRRPFLGPDNQRQQVTHSLRAFD